MNTDNPHLQAAIEALKHHDMITASVEATKAIEADPSCYEAYILRGQISMAFGDTKGASDDMRRALELNPDLQSQITGEYKN